MDGIEVLGRLHALSYADRLQPECLQQPRDVRADVTRPDDDRGLTTQIGRNFGAEQRLPLRTLLCGPPMRQPSCECEQTGYGGDSDGLGLCARSGRETHTALHVRLILLMIC